MRKGGSLKPNGKGTLRSERDHASSPPPATPGWRPDSLLQPFPNPPRRAVTSRTLRVEAPSLSGLALPRPGLRDGRLLPDSSARAQWRHLPWRSNSWKGPGFEPGGLDRAGCVRDVCVGGRVQMTCGCTCTCERCMTHGMRCAACNLWARSCESRCVCVVVCGCVNRTGVRESYVCVSGMCVSVSYV